MQPVNFEMSSEKLREIFEEVDSQLENKLEEVVRQTFEQIEQNSPPKESDLDNLYFEARQIGLEAYHKLRSWSEQTFVISPAKEFANAWIKGCDYRFEGPRSIQKEIRQKLSSKVHPASTSK